MAPAGGWYLPAEDAEALIVRPASPRDEATPNPNAVAIETLLRLAVFTGDADFTRRAEETLRRFAAIMTADIFSTASLAGAPDLAPGLVEVVLVTPPGADPEPLRRVVYESTDPRIVLFETESTSSLAPSHPAHGKTPVDGRASVWVCRRGACGLPTNDPATLRITLEGDGTA